MSFVERADVGQAVELEVSDASQVGMLEDQLDQAIAEPLAAVCIGDDHVEDERLECIVGDDSRETDQIASVVSESDADLRSLHATPGLFQRAVRGPPLAGEESVKLRDPSLVELVDGVPGRVRSLVPRYPDVGRANSEPRAVCPEPAAPTIPPSVFEAGRLLRER